MQEKDTEKLENELTQAETLDDVRHYLQANEPELSTETLSSYLTKLLAEKQLEKAVVIRTSKVPPNYAYHLFSGDKSHPNRNYVLGLALAMQLNVKEAQHLLYYAGVAPLYARNARDSAIMFALQQHASVAKTNEMLQKLGEAAVISEDDE